MAVTHMRGKVGTVRCKERNPLTREIMARLLRMQKLGLSVEAVALQAGTSEARFRLKLGIR